MPGIVKKALLLNVKNKKMYAQRCRKRGCHLSNGDIYFLWDREDAVNINGERYDIKALLLIANILLDKELEKERQKEENTIKTIGFMFYMSIILYSNNNKYNINDTVQYITNNNNSTSLDCISNMENL